VVNFNSLDPPIQPVPEKTRLKMLVEMQIEILDSGEILVKYEFKQARGGEEDRPKAGAHHEGRVQHRRKKIRLFQK